MKLQTSGVLGTSYAIAKLAPKRGTKYLIDNISVEDNCLYLSIINNATKEQFRIYLTQDKNKNTCIQSVSKIKNNEIIKILKFEIGKKYLNKLTTIIEDFDKWIPSAGTGL